LERPGKREAMDRLIQVDWQRLASEMQHDLEGMLAQVMDAVNGPVRLTSGMGTQTTSISSGTTRC
jgi:hypothetical protein